MMAVDDYMRRNGTVFWGGVYALDQREFNRHGTVEPNLGFNKSDAFEMAVELEGGIKSYDKRYHTEQRRFKPKYVLRKGDTMASKMFPKKMMQGILWGEVDESTIERDTIVGHDRWSVQHELIFQYKGQLYQCPYSKGATEMQDEAPFEYDNDMIECTMVKPVQKMVTEYESTEL